MVEPSEYMNYLVDDLCNPPQPRQLKPPKDPIDVVTSYIHQLSRENQQLEQENHRMADALMRIVRLTPDDWTRQYADYVLADIAQERGG